MIHLIPTEVIFCSLHVPRFSPGDGATGRTLRKESESGIVSAF
jgi:hypothetical protein